MAQSIAPSTSSDFAGSAVSKRSTASNASRAAICSNSTVRDHRMAFAIRRSTSWMRASTWRTCSAGVAGLATMLEGGTPRHPQAKVAASPGSSPPHRSPSSTHRLAREVMVEVTEVASAGDERKAAWKGRGGEGREKKKEKVSYGVAIKKLRNIISMLKYNLGQLWGRLRSPRTRWMRWIWSEKS